MVIGMTIRFCWLRNWAVGASGKGLTVNHHQTVARRRQHDAQLGFRRQRAGRRIHLVLRRSCDVELCAAASIMALTIEAIREAGSGMAPL